MITLSLSELKALGPCNMHNRRAWFGVTGRKRLDVVKALAAGATKDDILWVAVKLGRQDLCVRFALLCAQRVAYLNSDPSVQRALNAAQAWLDRPNKITANAAAKAAAYAAANAAAAKREVWVTATAILDEALKIGKQSEPLDGARIIQRMDAAKKLVSV